MSECRRSRGLDLNVIADKDKIAIALRSENYFDVSYTTVGFMPQGDLNPCQDLEGRPAKVEYVTPDSGSGAASAPVVIGIELHK